MRTSAFGRILKPSSMVAMLAIAGCVGAPGTPPMERAAEIPVTDSGGASEPAPPAAPSQAGAPVAPEVRPAAASGFATRNAYFQPVAWTAVPGWHQDDPARAWDAFRKSCDALARREVWQGVCARAATVAPGEARRRFFEQEFEPYEVRNSDRSRDGIITGYYEPLIAGRRKREGAFVYPIYGVPSDLLTLDTRLVPKSRRGAPVPVRIEGARVIPVVDGGGAPYVLDFVGANAGALDRRMRLRLVGDTVVPYPSRADIERAGLPRARVLAWVDNVAALYSMQIQGSGRIRFEDGQTLRLAYAEQNGHPFRPPTSRRTRSLRSSSLFARGLDIDFEAVTGETVVAGDVGAGEVLTRGARRSGPPSQAVLEADVERLVEALASGQTLGDKVAAPATVRPPAAAAARPPPSAAVAPSRPPAQAGGGAPPAPREQAPTAGARIADEPPAGLAPTSVAVMQFPQPSAASIAAISSDPSYVFFRPIPDGPGGPLGALGVPLTPGRSIAVDPRTTPLGFPVFISTTRPGGAEALNLLVMAQDTGGAIRGAVRADYFWGLGGSAFAQAARMKERGRLWLLLPRGLEVAARDRALRTRGVGGAAAPECLIADDEICVEDVE
jgi:membrane-bound lytic murein transglycosylase A